jgi:tetratricopeptide (TPR) repeat protein
MKDLFAVFDKASIDDKDKSQFNKLQREVAAKDIEWRCRFADGNTDWKGRLNRCQNAAPTPWSLAAKAESRLESKDVDLASMRAEAFNPKVDATGDYGKYVRARVSFAETKTAEALKEVLAIDSQSPWLVPGKDGPKYRGQKATEILLSDLAAVNKTLRDADAIKTQDLNFKKPETVENIYATVQPLIQRLVRARSFDAAESARKLHDLENRMKGVAPVLRQLADKALKKDDKDKALECAQGFKAFGGDAIASARLLGQVYAVRKEYARALRAFNEALPDLNSEMSPGLAGLTEAHFKILMERTYLIYDARKEIPHDLLPTPDSIIAPAERAVALASEADKGEALGAAGAAYDCAAEKWKSDDKRSKEIAAWRKAAIVRLLAALQTASDSVKQQNGWQWQHLVGVQVDELLSKPETAEIGRNYLGTAKTQLEKAINDPNTPDEERPNIRELLQRLMTK